MSKPIARIPDYRVVSRIQILSETIDYNHKMLNIPWAWRDTMGEGFKAAVLDTGLPEHVDIKPADAKSFVGGSEKDRQGHSTHAGSIIHATANNGMGIAGIAPKAEVYYGKVLGDNGSGGVGGIIDGIVWSVDEWKVDAISMSLGMTASFSYIPEFEEACNYAHKNGVLVLAACGNEAGKVGQPAKYKNVVAVAAIDSMKQHARFSNTGPEVQLAAPGVDVFACYLNNGYAALSGTSMACPNVAGVAALIQSKHIKEGNRLEPDKLLEHLVKMSVDQGPRGKDKLFGHGIPIFGKKQEHKPELPGQNFWQLLFQRIFGIFS